MAQTLSIGSRGKTWYVAAYMSLIAVTCIAAVLLLPFNLDFGQEVWSDAQDDEQRVASWRGSAVLAYTSGSGFGHVCALLAGMLAARWARHKRLRAGLVATTLAGAVLGLVNLSLASWRAAPRLRELTGAPALMSDPSVVVIDPGLRHHGCILAAMGVAFAMFLIAAAIGFGLAQSEPLLPQLFLVAATVVLAPAAHYVMTLALVPRPGPY